MKMVSQLTRQAMNRHRTLHIPAPYPPPAACAPQPGSPARTLYAPPAQPPEPAPVPIPDRPQSVPLQLPRAGSIYRQLMHSHDRMTERHLRRT